MSETRHIDEYTSRATKDVVISLTQQISRDVIFKAPRYPMRISYVMLQDYFALS